MDLLNLNSLVGFHVLEWKTYFRTMANLGGDDRADLKSPRIATSNYSDVNCQRILYKRFLDFFGFCRHVKSLQIPRYI